MEFVTSRTVACHFIMVHPLCVHSGVAFTIHKKLEDVYHVSGCISASFRNNPKFKPVRHIYSGAPIPTRPTRRSRLAVRALELVWHRN